jgi:hypothetical protein
LSRQEIPDNAPHCEFKVGFDIAFEGANEPKADMQADKFYFSNNARQGGLRLFRFLCMHSVMRGTSGITLRQNLKASSSQALRCSGVPALREVLEAVKSMRLMRMIVFTKQVAFFAMDRSTSRCDRQSPYGDLTAGRSPR